MIFKLPFTSSSVYRHSGSAQISPTIFLLISELKADVDLYTAQNSLICLEKAERVVPPTRNIRRNFLKIQTTRIYNQDIGNQHFGDNLYRPTLLSTLTRSHCCFSHNIISLISWDTNEQKKMTYPSDGRKPPLSRASYTLATFL